MHAVSPPDRSVSGRRPTAGLADGSVSGRRPTAGLADGSVSGRSDGDSDVAAITPTPFVKLAGGVLLLLGVFTLVLAFQTFLAFRAPVAFSAGPFFLLLGLTEAICGWQITRLRGRAAIAGAAAAGTGFLLGLVWAVLSLFWGLLSLLSLGLIPLALMATALAALVIGPCRRADAARERLRDQGFDAGL